MSLRTPAKRASLRRKDRIKFRAGVLARSKGQCDRCGEYHGDALHAHHYRPRSLGGSDDPRLPTALVSLTKAIQIDHGGNGVALCGKCHHDCHMRRGEAARWINSRNRSLPPGSGAPLDRGAAGISTKGVQP